MVGFKSLQNIDISTGIVIEKRIPSDFATFMTDYLNFAQINDSTKLYKVRDSNTQVISCILQLLSLVYDNEENSETLCTQLAELSLSIANRLLYVEKIAQEKIIQMNKFIKKGSLVQAIIPSGDSDDSCLYIIAKVEHSEWFDGESLQKSFGFPTEKKNVWKSAVVPLYFREAEILFGSIRVYTDNEAKYWATDFLELDEEKTDETNTRTAYIAIERLLNITLKQNYPHDYYILRNSVIREMRTPQIINYVEFIEKLVGTYQPEDDEVDLLSLKEKLLQLPEKKKFDTQFISSPKAIAARMRNRFPIIDGVSIHIDGPLDEFHTTITAVSDTVGSRFLKIKCTDNETYKAFGGK